MVERVLDVHIGDVAVLKKKHPCGSDRWDVMRIGADIGLKCQGCNRRMLVDRPKLRKRLKRIERTSVPAARPN